MRSIILSVVGMWASLGFANERYRWLDAEGESIVARFAPPDGFTRVKVAESSFGEWLRTLPLKPGRPAVKLFDGREKAEDVHLAVIDLDVGRKDLQQCADSIIRLRAEYLLSTRREREIAFHFTSGDLAEWGKWADGERPMVKGNKVTWTKSANADRSYANFRKYLDVVFTYAGTMSLKRELFEAKGHIEPGDVFVKAGSPGHAVIVVDVAEADGKRVFVLAQGYTPAQEMHILKNPKDGGAWYTEDFGEELTTPQWVFGKGDRRRYGK